MLLCLARNLNCKQNLTSDSVDWPMIRSLDSRSACQSGDNSIPKDALEDASSENNKTIYKDNLVRSLTVGSNSRARPI